MQKAIVTHGESDLAWIMESNDRADLWTKMRVWKLVHEGLSKENNMLRLGGGSGTIWLKVNNIMLFYM